jgi:signal transduction histidine kinase
MRNHPERQEPIFDPPVRSTVGPFVFAAAFAALAVANAWLAAHLVGSAAEERARAEVARTAQLLSRAGFPRSPEALARLAGFQDADLVAADAHGRIVETTLDPARRALFEQALVAGTVPSVVDRPRVVEADVGPRRARVTVGVSPASGHEPMAATFFVVYPLDLGASERGRAWPPVAIVAVLGTALAVVLGIVRERAVRRAKGRVIARVVASVSHELKNPLAAIETLARSLAERATGRERAALEALRGEATRLSLLVENLRSLGGVAPPVRRERVDLDRVVANVADLLERQLAHRRVRLEIEPGGAVALGDEARLRQAAWNLLLNAADAMPAGGTVRVRTTAGETARLEVEDQGEGIPDEVLPRIFEPFFSTKRGGTGLGLDIVKRSVVEQGGTIAVTTGPSGTKFTVELPVTTEIAREKELAT